jgi:hypothetical protein
MQISPAVSLAASFKKWFVAHPPSIDDDDSFGKATPIALIDSGLDERAIAPPEQPHRPWLVPGFGTL